MQRAGRWCGKCQAVHVGDCPAAVAWQRTNVIDRRMRGRPWLKLRAQVFARDEYLCQMCLLSERQSVITISGTHRGICDHIVPLSQGGTDALANLQTLCQSCSSIKTQQESLAGRGRG